MSSKYKITSLPKEDETRVDLYGASVGDMLHFARLDSEDMVWIKGSDVFREGGYSNLGRVCVACSMDDF